MAVRVSTFDSNNKLFNQQECKNTTESPHPNCHLIAMGVTMVVMSVVVSVVVTMRVIASCKNNI